MEMSTKRVTGAAAGVSARVKVRSALQAALFEGRLSLTYSEVRRGVLLASVGKGQPLPPSGSSEYRRGDRMTERGLATLQEEGIVEKDGSRYRLTGKADAWRSIVDAVEGLLTEPGLQPDAQERRNLRGVLIWVHPSGLAVSTHWVRPESREDFLKKARRLVSKIGVVGYDGMPALAGHPAGWKPRYTLEE